MQSESSEYLTLNAGSQPERNQGTLIYPSDGSEKISQAREIKAKELQGMQQNDLFKAEYVFIVDSEGEDEATSGKGEQSPPEGTGTTASRPKSLAISSSLVSDVVRPKTRGTDLQAPSYPEMSHGIVPQQKHGQVGFSSCHKKKKNVYILFILGCLQRPSCLRHTKLSKKKILKNPNPKIINHHRVNIDNKFTRQKRLYNCTVNWLKRRCKMFSWGGSGRMVSLTFEQFLEKVDTAWFAGCIKQHTADMRKILWEDIGWMLDTGMLLLTTERIVKRYARK